MAKASTSLTALGLALNAVASELDPAAVSAVTSAAAQIATAAEAQAQAEIATLAKDAEAAAAKLSTEAQTFFGNVLDQGLALVGSKLATLTAAAQPQASGA